MRQLLLSVLILSGCHATGTIQGTGSGQPLTGPPAPLPGAQIAVLCPQSTRVLANSNSDGTYRGGRVTDWPRECTIEASTADGSHASARQSVADLCRPDSDDRCWRIENADFVLRQVKPRQAVRVAFRPDRPDIELVRNDGEGTDEVLCSGRCEAELFAGTQRLSLRLADRGKILWSEEVKLSSDRRMEAAFVEDTDPMWTPWIAVPLMVAGVGLMYYGKEKDDYVPILGGLGTMLVGVGVIGIWMPEQHSAKVRWTAAPQLVR